VRISKLCVVGLVIIDVSEKGSVFIVNRWETLEENTQRHGVTPQESWTVYRLNSLACRQYLNCRCRTDRNNRHLGIVKHAVLVGKPHTRQTTLWDSTATVVCSSGPAGGRNKNPWRTLSRDTQWPVTFTLDFNADVTSSYWHKVWDWQPTVEPEEHLISAVHNYSLCP
jgi:hypothetical protein